MPRLLVDWLRQHSTDTYREVEGSLAFVDISGFTTLTERLARKGKVGAEEMSDVLNATFAQLLAVAYEDGAGLVKWGGDAVLLLFEGPDHASRACRAAFRMRATLRTVGRLQTTAGQVVLRMSVGIHSGTFHFFLVGDPAYHRELIVSGPAASTTAVMESIAQAGEIGISAATAAAIDPRCVGPAKEEAYLLRSTPEIPAVGVPAVTDVEDLDLARVIPVGIRQHLLAEPGDAEHRTIAVAFVQFSGTDELLLRSGPAALADALDEMISNVQQATAAHGVTFFETDINRDGGKVMLTAGAPVSHGHEEDRMLRAARLVIDRAGALALRIGVNRGPVFSGDFGPPFRRTYSVKGDAINLAARVMGKAGPGELLATRAVIDRVRTGFDTSDLPPFRVKGKSQPVDAVRVGAVLGSVEEHHRLPPLVGRAAELAALDAALAQVQARQGSRIEVLGEPGIGKTRLMQELHTRAQDVVPLVVTCDEYETNTPYVPVRRLFRSALGIPETATAVQVSDRLRARVTVNAPELLPWLPLIGIVLGTELPPTPETLGLDEAFRRGRLEAAAVDLLKVVLATPTLLLVEDAHFADEASLDLLKGVRAAVAGQPWVFVSTTREDTELQWGDGPADQILRLGRLGPEEALRLALDATSEAPMPPATLDALVDRSGGNPLFLRGLLLVADGGGGTDALPDSLDGLIDAEIDRLPPAPRRLLRYASVLGTTVDEELLREMVDHDLPVGAAAFRPLYAFVQAAGPGRFRFRHALIRDSAYEGLPYRSRRALHEKAGETLLGRLGEPATSPEPLAMHFFYAGRAAEAWTYSLLAGQRAQAQYAQAEAARFLQWAADSGRRAGRATSEIVDVLEQLGDVQYFLGLSTNAAQTYRRALHLARGEPVRQAGLLLKEGRIQQRLGNLSQSLRRLTKGMRLVDGVATAPALRVHSLLATRYAIGLLQEGRFGAARRWGDLAVELGVGADDPSALADAHNALEAVTLWSGQPSEVSHGEVALALYEQLEDLTGQGHCLNNLAVRAVLEGRWDDGQLMLHRAAEIFGKVGDEASLAAATYNQADVLVRQGRVDEAEPLLQRALRVARSVDDEETVALVLRESGKAAARALRYDEGRALLAQAIERLTDLGEPQEVADAEAAIAETYLLEGRWEDALEACRRGLSSSGTPATVLPTLLRVQGFALLLGHDQAGARAAFEAGLALAGTPVTRHESALLRHGLAQVLLEQDEAEGRLLLARSAEDMRGLGVVSPPLPTR